MKTSLFSAALPVFKEDTMAYKRLIVLLLAFAVLSPNALVAADRILHNFNATPNGNAPFGGLVQDASGNLYGTTSAGGAYGFGTVFTLTPNGSGGWNYSVLYSFRGDKDGNFPVGAMAFDSSGNLYGLTSYGGGLGVCKDQHLNNVFCGTVFKLVPQGRGWTESVIFRFDDANGGTMLTGGLVIDAAGNLYSTTYSYNGGHGSVFQLVFSSGRWAENILYAFTGGLDGGDPNSPLYLDPAGNIFGAASEGGTANEGVVFELTESGNTWTERVLYDFLGGNDGAQPSTGLASDSSGNLYGATSGGGANPCTGWGCGTVFKLVPSGNGGWTESVIYSFTSSSNSSPEPISLITDGQGNLYGSTYFGGKCSQCGFVFQLTPTGNGQWTETTVWKFGAGADGQNPSFIIVNPAGQIFGTSSLTGALDYGTVFQLAKDAGGHWTETTISEFAPNVPDAQYPQTPLISDAAGNLYGMAAGGPYGNGAVFELMPQSGGGWKQRILYGFPHEVNYVGQAGLTFDTQGNLFGVTGVGGGQWGGTLFELLPISGGRWQYKTLFNFPTGAGYPSGLVLDNAGHLFVNGFTLPYGQILELTQGSDGQWTEQVIHKFAGYPTDGTYPNNLIIDPAGNLYGTTNYGGSGDCSGGYRGCGTVFELSPSGSGWTETVLYNFTDQGQDGKWPTAGVVMDLSGNLFGTTSQGGKAGCNGPSYTACGTVFELSPVGGGGWTKTNVYAFNTTGDGNTPFGGVVLDQQGNLYGTTAGGGSNVCGTSGCGVVFELSPVGDGTWTESLLQVFGSHQEDGTDPWASLLLDSAGNLYGTTQSGGKAMQGTVFEVQP